MTETMAATPDCRYFRQENPFACGAACLQMAYASLGMQIAQAELWENTKEVPQENGAFMRRMAQDALRRGFAALTVIPREPWSALQSGCEPGVRIILNHRPHHDSTGGHYSLLLSATEDYLVTHDPAQGPSRILPRERFLTLWEPRGPSERIAGFSLLAISRPAKSEPVCPSCGSGIPQHWNCPQCRREFSLQPVLVLGCADGQCSGRRWRCIHCPHCGAGLVMPATRYFSSMSTNLSNSTRTAKPTGEP